MTGIALLLLGAAAGFGIARLTRLPAVPFLILAGVLLAWTDLAPGALLQDALVLGLTFLVFSMGVELNPRRVGAQRAAAVRVGVVQFTVLAGAGFAGALALGYDATVALYLAAALSASSTLVVVRLLQQRGQMFEPFGRLVLGVLLVQDILMILLLPVLVRLPEGGISILVGLAETLGLMGVAWICGKWLIPRILLPIQEEEEILLVVGLAFLMSFVAVAHFLRLPLVAGAFLAGVALSPFPVSGLIRGQLFPLSDFFLAIFFTALGGLLIVPTAADLLRALALAAIVVTVTPPLVTVVAERSGLSARSALEGGLLLSQTSEFSLIVGLQGLIAGALATGDFTTIALVTVLTMILTPFLATDGMTWRLLRFHPVRRRPISPSHADHILLLGCGDSGMPLLETLIAHGHEVLVIDDDPTVIRRLQDGDVETIRGDGADLTVLQRAGAARARMVISTLRRPGDIPNVLPHFPGVPFLVRVFDPATAERIARAGGTPILYTDAAAESVLKWARESGVLP